MDSLSGKGEPELEDKEKRDIRTANGRKATVIVSSHEGGRGPSLSPLPDYLLSDIRQEGGASSWASVFTLCNSAIGAGVLSLPFAFQSAGEGADRMCESARDGTTSSLSSC